MEAHSSAFQSIPVSSNPFLLLYAPTNMLVKFKIILDINSEVLFTIYHNKIHAVTIFIFHLIVKIWVIFTNVQNFTLIHIEKHKPLNGPLA